MIDWAELINLVSIAVSIAAPAIMGFLAFLSK